MCELYDVKDPTLNQPEICIRIHKNGTVEVEVQWHVPEEIPKDKNPNQPMFSEDVLIHTETDESSIGWYDYGKKDWQFLCREDVGEFKWRYINNFIDKS